MRFLPLIGMAAACHAASQSPPVRTPRPAGEILVRVFEGRDVSPEGYRPVAGAVVVAHGSDGAMLQTSRTDGLGQVRLSDFPAGGAISIADPQSPATLRTVFAVMPGDLIDVPLEHVSPRRGRLSGRWKPFPGAAGYQFSDGCNETHVSTPEVQEEDLRDRCVSPWHSASAIVFAMDETGRNLAYATVTGALVEPETGTRVAFGPWKTDFATLALKLPTGRAAETTVRLRRYDGTGSVILRVPSPSWEAPLAIPSGFYDELIVEQVAANRRLLRSLPWPAKAAATDAMGDSPSLEVAPPVVDSQGPLPTLHTRVVGLTADMLTGVVRWGNVRWSFVAPPGMTTIRFPALPAELGALVPSGAPQLVSVTAVDHSHFESWDDARRELRWASAFGTPQEVIDLGGFVAMASAESR